MKKSRHTLRAVTEALRELAQVASVSYFPTVPTPLAVAVGRARDILRDGVRKPLARLPLRLLPEGYYLRIENERAEDDGRLVFGCCLFQAVPDGGWETGCDYFGHDHGHEGKMGPQEQCCWNVTDFLYKFDDRCISSVTAVDIRAFMRLTAGMIRSHFAPHGVTENK